MIKSHKIMFQEKNVGEANIEKNGLFYRIICKCRLTQGGKYRIIMECKSISIDLGICVPCEDGFRLSSHIPINKASGEIVSFFVQQQSDNAVRFFEVSSEKQFPYLSQLTHAKFLKQDQLAGITIDCIIPKDPIQQGSDQIP